MNETRLGGGRPAPAGSAHWRVLRKTTTTSTNVDVHDLARSGDPGRVWIVSERQDGGRARRGRTWTSEPGNLYASALLIDPCTPSHLSELPFVSVLAAADAVTRVTDGGCAPGIKWPNDLMLSDRKLAGILLETTRTGDGRTAVAVGIGINCRHHPLATETPATSLSTEGFDVLPERLFDDLLVAFSARLEQWDQGRGFPAIRAAWLERAVRLGERIRVRLVDGEDEGVFEAIDEAGLLILAHTDGSHRKISAGDVFFPHSGRVSEE